MHSSAVLNTDETRTKQVFIPQQALQPPSDMANDGLLQTLSGAWSAGIDFDLAGNGGQACRDTVSISQRLGETIVATGIAAACLLYANRLRQIEAVAVHEVNHNDVHGEREKEHARHFSTSRILLLVVFTFTFGLEVGYKFSTRQLVFLFNPCHVLSLVNIYLLSAAPSTFSQNVHLFTLHTLMGPLLALLLPVTNTLHLPFEKETFWLQHILLVVSPVFLTFSRAEYRALDPLRLSGILTSFAIWNAYHFVAMHWLAVYTLANVGSMLCPALSDPFHGPFNRLHGLWHQGILVFVMGALAAGVRRIAESGQTSEQQVPKKTC